MTWQPSDDLQAILEYLEGGLSKKVLEARLFQIAMQDDTLSIAIKAIEILNGMSTDEPTTGELSYSQLRIVQNLTSKILGAEDDNLTTIIEYLSEQSDPDGDSQSIPEFLHRVGADDVSRIQASQTQSGDYASSDTGETGENQAVSDRDASQTRENRDNLGAIPPLDTRSTS